MKAEQAFKWAMGMNVLYLLISIAGILIATVLGFVFLASIIGAPLGFALGWWALGSAVSTTIFGIVTIFAWKRKKIAYYLLIIGWIIMTLGSLALVFTIIFAFVPLYGVIAIYFHLRGIEALNPQICDRAAFLCEKKQQ